MSSASSAAKKKPRGRPFGGSTDERRFRGGTRSPLTTSDGRTLSQLARDASEDGVKLLHQVVQSVDEDIDTRVRAAAVLLSLGWGSAPKQLGALNVNVEVSDARGASSTDMLALAKRALYNSAANDPQSPIIDVTPEVVMRKRFGDDEPRTDAQRDTRTFDSVASDVTE